MPMAAASLLAQGADWPARGVGAAVIAGAARPVAPPAGSGPARRPGRPSCRRARSPPASPGVAPSETRRCAMAGVASACTAASRSAAMISAGRRAVPSRAVKLVLVKPGTPPSMKVGTSGSCGTRASAATSARMRALPSLVQRQGGGQFQDRAVEIGRPQGRRPASRRRDRARAPARRWSRGSAISPPHGRLVVPMAGLAMFRLPGAASRGRAIPANPVASSAAPGSVRSAPAPAGREAKSRSGS